jgi:hypothetical protein
VVEKPRVLVLECPWDPRNLSSATSVRPFFEGWSDLFEVPLSVRSFHSTSDLDFWLDLFARPHGPQVCYVAGHGYGGRLQDLRGGGIDVKRALIKAFGQSGQRVRGQNKGILLGSCEVGDSNRLEGYLETTGDDLSWVAGYDREVPWLESAHCDLLFLTYLLMGRAKWTTRRPSAARNAEAPSPRLVRSSKAHPTDAEEASVWVKEDFALAELMGFSARARRG